MAQFEGEPITTHSGGLAILSSDEQNVKPPAQVFYGPAATRAAVLAEVGKDCPIGSMYISNASAAVGHIYFKTLMTAAGANTDWLKVTVTAAD